MSGLFYVFMKWSNATDHERSAKHCRFMLCLNSRYEADELFRALKDLKDDNTPRFTTLTRTSAQFWCHQAAGMHEISPSFHCISHINMQIAGQCSISRFKTTYPGSKTTSVRSSYLMPTIRETCPSSRIRSKARIGSAAANFSSETEGSQISFGISGTTTSSPPNHDVRSSPSRYRAHLTPSRTRWL